MRQAWACARHHDDDPERKRNEDGDIPQFEAEASLF
jgi:hypothetical protein